jgi:hypothetical protein
VGALAFELLALSLELQLRLPLLTEPCLLLAFAFLLAASLSM